MTNRKLTRFTKNNDGVSLVELIVAVAMLAVIMTPFMRTFLMALRVSDSSSQYSDTTLQVGNVIESVKNANMATLAQDLEASYGSLVAGLSDEANGKYVYDNGDQTVVVTNKTIATAKAEFIAAQILDGETATDAEAAADKEFAFLSGLNEMDLSVYTNMDATLVQAAGATDVITSTGSSTTTTTRVVRDIDIYAYLAMLEDEDASTPVSASNMQRTIDVELERVGDNLKYEVVYKYGWPDNKNTTYDWGVTNNQDGTLFSGTIPPGSDGIYSLQFVYIPMNVQTSADNGEIININYTGKADDEYAVRFFLIKQLRTTCAVGCLGSDSNYDEYALPESGFACSKCADSNYEEDEYTLKVNLVGTYTGDVAFQTNVATNLYTGIQIDDMSHFSYNGGSLDGMNLVYDNAGDRVSLVTVDIYDAKSADFDASTSTLLSSMQTLKLS